MRLIAVATCCTILLDPLVVRDAWVQILHHVQEDVAGRFDEHDASIFLRGEDSILLGELRNKVMADNLEIVLT